MGLIARSGYGLAIALHRVSLTDRTIGFLRIRLLSWPTMRRTRRVPLRFRLSR